jgi:O-antigen/teichoic acid export membrane protein
VTDRAADWSTEERQFTTVARNVATRYLAIATDGLIGLLLLPLNLAYLGPAAYGLWVLTASITVYSSILDLGYGGSVVRFVARYRAWRDRAALNEILSTLFFVFTAVGAIAYAMIVFLAFRLDAIFTLGADQAVLGRHVLLVIGVHVACGFPFSVFGGVINGFQRYYLNNIVGTATSVVVALVNVAVLMAGYGLRELVVATTAVRVTAYFVYRLNAYRVFPELRIRPSSFRWSRLREVTGFSVYVSCIDWANKLNYSAATIIIGAFLDSVAVAVWAVPLRLAQTLQRLTNQLNGVLFPLIVDSDAARRSEQLQLIFVQGTRLSLATVVPIGLTMALLARPLVLAWVGPRFLDSVLLVQILAAVVIIRVGDATASIVLKGAGWHRFLATANLATAAVNILLSVSLIRFYGLVGVAVSTLIPIALVSSLVLFPAACRRVGVPLRTAVARGVWPAVWPGVVMSAVVWPAAQYVSASLLAVAAIALAGGIVYAVCFVGLALGADDRRLYLAKAGELLQPIGNRITRLGPASATTP